MMQSYQRRGDSAPIKGANVNLAQVTGANNSGLAAGLGAVDGLDNFRKIKNKNSIMDLLKKSDSANYGQNIGEISALAADTTADGSAAASQGMGQFQKKANQDLTGLGKILAANKATSSSKANGSLASAINTRNKLTLMPKQGSETNDQYNKRKFKYDNAVKAADANIANRRFLTGSTSGNQGRVDEAARTMNKYFDRKMDFGQSTPGTGVAGGSGAGEGNPLQTIVEQQQANPETVVEQIKKADPSKNDTVFNPETGIMNMLKNASQLKAPIPKPKGNAYVRPAPTNAPKLAPKAGARAPGPAGPNFTMDGKKKAPNMNIDPNLKGSFKVPKNTTNIIDTIKDFGKGVIKNPANIAKALNPGVAGGLLMSTDAGQTDKQQAAAMKDGVVSTDGMIKPQVVNGQLVYPGDKGYKEPKAVEKIKSKYIQKGSPVKDVEAFSMNFNEDKSAIEARQNARVADQALADAKYAEYTAKTPVAKLAAQSEVRRLENVVNGMKSANASDRATGLVADNLKKYDGNDSKMATNVTQLVKDATGNKGDYNLLKNSLSERSYAILDKIIKSPSIKSENGQYSVALGESSAGFGGNDLVLTGDSRIELAQQYLQLMMNVSQDPESTKQFIDNNFPEEHRRIVYDQINPDSRSVYQSDKSNFLMRNFRNTPVADAPLSPDYGGIMGDGGVIPNWIDENIKG